MKTHPWPLLVAHAQKWFRSVHAKLFIVTGLVTSGITLGVAYTITSNSRKEKQDEADPPPSGKGSQDTRPIMENAER